MLLMPSEGMRRINFNLCTVPGELPLKTLHPSFSSFSIHGKAQQKPSLTLGNGICVQRPTQYIPGHIPSASLGLVISLLVRTALIFLTGHTNALIILLCLLRQKYICFSPLEKGMVGKYFHAVFQGNINLQI